MSKTVKSLITNDYTQKFGSSSDAMVISIRGIKGIDVTKLRKTLRKNQVKITVIRNSLAKRMVKGSSLEKLEKFLSGPSALATGTSVVEVAREIVGLLKEFPGIELKGAVLDGTLFEGDKGVKELQVPDSRRGHRRQRHAAGRSRPQARGADPGPGPDAGRDRQGDRDEAGEGRDDREDRLSPEYEGFSRNIDAGLARKAGERAGLAPRPLRIMNRRARSPTRLQRKTHDDC